MAAYLAGTGPITRLWHFKHSALKGLFRFAVSRGLLKKAPLPTEVPKCPPTLVPYIYSRAEIRRLLDAIPVFRRPDIRVEPQGVRLIAKLPRGADALHRALVNPCSLSSNRIYCAWCLQP